MLVKQRIRLPKLLSPWWFIRIKMTTAMLADVVITVMMRMVTNNTEITITMTIPLIPTIVGCLVKPATPKSILLMTMIMILMLLLYAAATEDDDDDDDDDYAATADDVDNDYYAAPCCRLT